MFSEKEDDIQWKKLTNHFHKELGKAPDVEAFLFLIGIQELGEGPKEYSKEEKQNLMHIASCKVLSYSGYYTLNGNDDDGWPHWDLKKEVPALNLKEQEKFIRWHIVKYFEELEII